jgi:hypothetical protein
MTAFDANQGIKRITVDAVVIRKDGSQEDLGTVAEWNKDDSPTGKVKGVIQLIKNLRS